MQLPGVEVRFNKGIDPVLTTLSQQTDSNFLRLGITIAQNYCEVVAPSKQVVAVLNMKSFRQLARVQKEVHFRLEGAADLLSWLLSDNSPGNQKGSRYCSIDILVFGYRQEAELVAANLATNGLFLQDPDHVPPGFIYENPQCLDLPFMPGAETSQIERTIMEKASPARERVPAQEDDFELDYDRVLDAFACHDGLIEAKAVAQVKTTLLRYTTVLPLVTNFDTLSAIKEKAWISFCNVRAILSPLIEGCGKSKSPIRPKFPHQRRRAFKYYRPIVFNSN